MSQSNNEKEELKELKREYNAIHYYNLRYIACFFVFGITVLYFIISLINKEHTDSSEIKDIFVPFVIMVIMIVFIFNKYKNNNKKLQLLQEKIAYKEKLLIANIAKETLQTEDEIIKKLKEEERSEAAANTFLKIVGYIIIGVVFLIVALISFFGDLGNFLNKAGDFINRMPG